ncbi:prostaglandin E2 receptor EP1 subtype [Latimeria chalumnae]|uniref:Thromboxane A2 receptor n=1 Tax=Latimeria chalumnae TaxID=7897 RepID=H3B8V8_LATCH|nr:PREDICTED: prostaglandin E2 receptor EP1 subtype [Latimeria chalumnae]|eukprot:XP_005995923.1 PREDICTED: prostaglandin E2 receptor EP1 subtype [Latimeria chalumnae]
MCLQDSSFNSCCSTTNGSAVQKTMSPIPSASAAVPSFSMTLGAMSNIIALVILVKSYARFRRRSKATFLLFASSLVITDFAGHVIPGAIVLRLYTVQMPSMEESGHLCQFFGTCMVFFGLCPLFLGCVMAVERCVGVTRPLLHSFIVTSTRTKLTLLAIWMFALFVSLLPTFKFGSYGRQFPGTWCFIKVQNICTWDELAFALLFSLLGLASLFLSLVCNIISGVTLMRARLKKLNRNRRAKSHDIEMVVQLVGIMVVSCICWSPILIFVVISVSTVYSSNMEHFNYLMFLGVRLAAWNQILDPWVYILLRRAVMKKVYNLCVRHPEKGSIFSRWEASSFQSSERSVVNRI